MDYEAQGKAVVEKCVKRYGAMAWQTFGPDIRDAFICQEVVAVAQMAASVGGGTCRDMTKIVAVARNIVRDEA
jgi:glycerol dehydrogenase-like iron-containing ADH family enzyme